MSFLNWLGLCLGGFQTNRTCTVEVDSNMVVTANFAFAVIPPRVLTVSRTGSGTGAVTSSPTAIRCGSLCSGQFPAGSRVTLTAFADTGSTFAGWSGGGCSGTGTCTGGRVGSHVWQMLTDAGMEALLSFPTSTVALLDYDGPWATFDLRQATLVAVEICRGQFGQSRGGTFGPN